MTIRRSQSPYLRSSMSDERSDEQTAPDTASSEMSFMEHLSELRIRLFRSVLGLLIACIVVAFWREELMTYVLLRPALEAKVELMNTEPFGQAFLYFKVIFFGGLVLSFPWLMYQLWSFVAPGLYHHERRWARAISLLTTICFVIGLAFGYYVLIPSMMSYIDTVGNANIKDIISVTSYFSFFINMMLASGFIFELPMVTWVLARFGMVTAAFLNKYRRHAIVIILILAAVITPTPDPLTQLMVAVPLYVLFEISIVIAKFSAPKPR